MCKPHLKKDKVVNTLSNSILWRESTFSQIMHGFKTELLHVKIKIASGPWSRPAETHAKVANLGFGFASFKMWYSDY